MTPSQIIGLLGLIGTISASIFVAGYNWHRLTVLEKWQDKTDETLAQTAEYTQKVRDEYIPMLTGIQNDIQWIKQGLLTQQAQLDRIEANGKR